jgi:hypothetical protein
MNRDELLSFHDYLNRLYVTAKGFEKQRLTLFLDDLDFYMELYENNFRPQSQIVTEKVEDGDNHEILSINESAPVGHNPSDLILDPVASSIYTDEYEIANFLHRPHRIASYYIPQAESFVTREIYPWYAFFNATPIKKKVDNYAFVQCKLHIKVIVKSTPFVYGHYTLSYQPQKVMTAHNFLAGSDEFFRIPLSQRENIVIEPHKNKGGEMELPFFHYKNWLELTSATELQDMGVLQL